MIPLAHPSILLALAGAASGLGAPASAAVSPLALVGPIASYKVYVARNVATLVADTRGFTAAVKAGDLAKAQKLFAPTRMSYERIEPIAELFSDMDSAIVSRADDHEKREKDPRFGGFHRLEYALWVEKNPKAATRIADKLMRDVLTLQQRITTLTFPPEKVVGGAAALMEEVAATKISGEEDRYSHTDLWDFQANFEGAYEIVTLLRPIVAKQDKAFSDRVEANFRTVFTTLARYRAPGGGFAPYSRLTPRDRALLAGKVNILAEDLSRLRGILGLN